MLISKAVSSYSRAIFYIVSPKLLEGHDIALSIEQSVSLFVNYLYPTTLKSSIITPYGINWVGGHEGGGNGGGGGGGGTTGGGAVGGGGVTNTVGQI